MVVLVSENPQPFIRTVAVARFHSAEMVLRSCREIDENIPRRELDSLLADEWDETVLAPYWHLSGSSPSIPIASI